MYIYICVCAVCLSDSVALWYTLVEVPNGAAVAPVAQAAVWAEW